MASDATTTGLPGLDKIRATLLKVRDSLATVYSADQLWAVEMAVADLDDVLKAWDGEFRLPSGPSLADGLLTALAASWAINGPGYRYLAKNDGPMTGTYRGTDFATDIPTRVVAPSEPEGTP